MLQATAAECGVAENADARARREHKVGEGFARLEAAIADLLHFRWNLDALEPGSHEGRLANRGERGIAVEGNRDERGAVGEASVAN